MVYQVGPARDFRRIGLNFEVWGFPVIGSEEPTGRGEQERDEEQRPEHALLLARAGLVHYRM